MRVLLVEDDELLGDGVYHGLKQYSHVVDWVKDGRTAEQALKIDEFDAVVLDLGLPKQSGLETLRHIRSRGILTPVLILTARETIDDRVAGLDSGADDYMTKPFDLDELAARLRALQRRSRSRAAPLVEHGDITLDPASHTIEKNGEPMHMSRREFALVQRLLENAGRVLSREYLSQTLYGWDEEVDSNALEVHIHKLRKKLGNDFIRTIRGIGYMIDKAK
ncbi:MAG: DNA-binding response regulator [Gammaproteobacteria bacterium CG11_big_fil_rev_8_21_14_0_20_46_22]|nr:MAG: DNA-binding response regulator [Gammaproteobacteria bacterium CG12_big_fil_rev_8_21_14_0_65_46_12]PIR10899.1 MAG: DNA-binding response regulator [Gammaproteobacteria bacterium CG11_big_fil_rev_8_21_14_0_20_46_22]